MKKHKNKIIAAAVIVAVLAAAWFWGGNYNRKGDDATGYAAATQGGQTPAITAESSAPVADASGSPGTSTSQGSGSSGDAAKGGAGSAENGGAGVSQPSAGMLDTAELPAFTSKPAEPESPETSGPSGATEPSAIDETPAPGESPSSAEPTMVINPETGKDKYLTDPVPDGKPLPVEPEDVTVGDGAFTVTLTIRCDTILDNMNLLHRDKHELVPEDGVIFPVTTVTAYEGESVFNVLQRETRRIRLHLSSRFTPIYNSAYIEAINNLYEFDVGELSGWMYCVNDWYPNYGCSRYVLKPGDVIEWRYTCDLGRDLGQLWLVGGQKDS